MGLKHEARARAVAADVPVLPGSELVSTVGAAVEQADKVGYPVMLKATGGGGGMGMSICGSADELRKAFKSTTELSQVRFLSRSPSLHTLISQLQTLFSNGGVFIEKYIAKARSRDQFRCVRHCSDVY